MQLTEFELISERISDWASRCIVEGVDRRALAQALITQGTTILAADSDRKAGAALLRSFADRVDLDHG
jgi:hypothetical protein